MAVVLRTFDVEITEEDLKNGVPFDGCRCPGALALKRATGIERVSVSQLSCEFSVTDKTAGCTIVDTPDELSMFVFLYDLSRSPHGRAVLASRELVMRVPVRFTISIPMEEELK